MDRARIEAWIVAFILRRHHGRLKLADGTVAVHQSAAFHAWCYGPGYMMFRADAADTTAGDAEPEARG